MAYIQQLVTTLSFGGQTQGPDLVQESYIRASSTVELLYTTRLDYRSFYYSETYSYRVFIDSKKHNHYQFRLLAYGQ